MLPRDRKQLRRVQEMSDSELRDHIEECRRMERSVAFNKARRSWVQARHVAEEEAARRGL